MQTINLWFFKLKTNTLRTEVNSSTSDREEDVTSSDIDEDEEDK